jgi:hypothetical protein
MRPLPKKKTSRPIANTKKAKNTCLAILLVILIRLSLVAAFKEFSIGFMSKRVNRPDLKSNLFLLKNNNQLLQKINNPVFWKDNSR